MTDKAKTAKHETPKQVRERAEKIIKSAAAMYGFPPRIERFLLATHPVFCAELHWLRNEGQHVETVRSAGVLIILNQLRELIEGTTPPEEHKAITRKMIGFIGAALLNVQTDEPGKEPTKQ